MNYADVKNAYLSKEEKMRTGSHDWYRALSLSGCIDQATSTMDIQHDGKRTKDLHKRYSKITLNECKIALQQRVRSLKTARNFDELLAEVSSALDAFGVKGVAELGRYDFAIKIGAKLGLAPTDRIYVHRAPLRVAQALQLTILRTREGSTYFSRDELESRFPVFSDMKADAIENMFCIYKKQLLAIAFRR